MRGRLHRVHNLSPARVTRHRPNPADPRFQHRERGVWEVAERRRHGGTQPGAAPHELANEYSQPRPQRSAISQTRRPLCIKTGLTRGTDLANARTDQRRDASANKQRYKNRVGWCQAFLPSVKRNHYVAVLAGRISVASKVRAWIAGARPAVTEGEGVVTGRLRASTRIVDGNLLFRSYKI